MERARQHQAVDLSRREFMRDMAIGITATVYATASTIYNVTRETPSKARAIFDLIGGVAGAGFAGITIANRRERRRQNEFTHGEETQPRQ